MSSSCRHCCCCCHSCCCGGCDCDDSGVGGVVQPDLTQFPVYVSYPAFFAGDSAINGANQAIFGMTNGSTLTGSSCGCRR